MRQVNLFVDGKAERFVEFDVMLLALEREFVTPQVSGQKSQRINQSAKKWKSGRKETMEIDQ